MTRTLRPVEADIRKMREMFPGKHLMTPEVLGYYKLKRGYAELSQGTGMRNQPIWGVTIKGFGFDDAEDRRLSDCFQSHAAAMERIEELSSERT